MAGDTPFKYYKQYTHYGGTKDPLIVHWANGIRDKGKIRTQFHHAIDIVPTILEAVRVEPPAQIGEYTQAPIEGVSMFYSFNDANAPTRKQIQYFEMLGNRGIWYKGWKAVTFHGRLPWEMWAKWSFDQDKWELYNLEEDFSECHDLSDKHQDKLRQLVELWWAEAGKYNVLPLADRFRPALGLVKDKASYTYYPGAARIPEGTAPHTINRSYTITAELEIPSVDGHGEGPEGPICAIGGVNSGWSLYIKERRLVYCYNYLTKRTYIRSTKEIPTGKKVKVQYQFDKTGQEQLGAGGIGRLYVDNEKVGEGQIQQTIKARYSLDEGFDIGRDSGSPVTEEYKPGMQFTGGNIEKVVFDIVGDRHIDNETEVRIAMKRQ